jgi:hypothetical protein
MNDLIEKDLQILDKISALIDNPSQWQWEAYSSRNYVHGKHTDGIKIFAFYEPHHYSLEVAFGGSSREIKSSEISDAFVLKRLGEISKRIVDNFLPEAWIEKEDAQAKAADDILTALGGVKIPESPPAPEIPNASCEDRFTDIDLSK